MYHDDYRIRTNSKPLLDTVLASGNAPNNSTLAVKTTKARFWVLLVFCLLAICQSCTWNIYSPIYKSCLLAFPEWNSSYLNWLINSANMSFGLSLYPISIAIKKYGPRKVTLFSAFMILSGASLRCIPIADPQTQKIVQIVAMLCNGFGGAFLNFGGPIVSELWFPSHERTTATAVASVATYCGAALGFVVGPTIVGNPVTMEAAKSAIFTLYYGEAAVCMICFIMCLCYYPNQPIHPPSEAASLKRNKQQKDQELLTDLQDTMSMYSGYTEEGFNSSSSPSTSNSNSNSNGLSSYFSCSRAALKYWVVALCMGLPLGIFQGWSSTMFSCLKPLDITEDEASWLGFFTTAAGCVGAVFVGFVLDRFAGRLKLVTELCLITATTCFGVFGLNAAGYLDVEQKTRVMIAYITSITGGAALNISVPLFFELIMESIYGWADESIGSMLTIFINTVVQISFLIALAEMDPLESKLWTSWALCGSMLVASVVMLFLKVDYRRLSVDLGKDVKETGCWFDRGVGFY